jgi:predicted ester cyclase
MQLAKRTVEKYLLTLLALILCSCTRTKTPETDRKANMNNYKKEATLWYEAFTNKDPALLDRILHKTWVDIPSPRGTPAGPEGVKPLLIGLTTIFPDLKLTVEDILQDRDTVVVRARMAGTQQEAFMGFPAKHRKMDIQVVDIHEFKGGKIFRTWQTEDWMSGLRQSGVFESKN